MYVSGFVAFKLIKIIQSKVEAVFHLSFRKDEGRGTTTVWWHSRRLYQSMVWPHCVCTMWNLKLVDILLRITISFVHKLHCTTIGTKHLYTITVFYAIEVTLVGADLLKALMRLNTHCFHLNCCHWEIAINSQVCVEWRNCWILISSSTMPLLRKYLSKGFWQKKSKDSERPVLISLGPSSQNECMHCNYILISNALQWCIIPPVVPYTQALEVSTHIPPPHLSENLLLTINRELTCEF